MKVLLLLLAVSGGVLGESRLDQSLSPCSGQIQLIEGSFSQSLQISVLKAPLLSSGEFHYQRGEGLIWHTTQPVDNKIHIDPKKGVVSIGAENNPHTIPGSKIIADIFLGLFSCDLGYLGKYFTIATGTERGHWSLRLTPKDPGMAERIEVIHMEGGEHIDRVDIVETNGDRRELTFNVTVLKRAID
jgi:hypothetical protein